MISFKQFINESLETSTGKEIEKLAKSGALKKVEWAYNQFDAKNLDYRSDLDNKVSLYSGIHPDYPEKYFYIWLANTSVKKDNEYELRVEVDNGNGDVKYSEFFPTALLGIERMKKYTGLSKITFK